MLIRPLLKVLNDLKGSSEASAQSESETLELLQAELQRKGESGVLKDLVHQDRQYAPVPVTVRRQNPPC